MASKSHDLNSDSENEWIVEKILDKRIIGNSAEYLLKWKGYSKAYNSWVKEGDLECYELLWNFEREREEEEKEIQEDCDSSNYSSDYETYKQRTKSINKVIIDNNNLSEPVPGTSKEGVEDSDSSEKLAEEEQYKTGFELGLIPDQIIGASDADAQGRIMLLIRWTNNDLELISSQDAKKYCPLLLIDFYETFLTWD